MTKPRRRKRKANTSMHYIWRLLILSVFLFGIYGIYHLGATSILKDAPKNSQEKEAITMGIDLSEWQNNVDFEKVKNEGYSFVILRTSYGVYKNQDEKFEEHYKHAKDANLKIGVYHYSHATTVDEAIQEANFVLDILDSRHLDLPVFYDIEDHRQDHLTKSQLTEIALAFLKTIEDAGYDAGVYAAKSWFKDRLYVNLLDDYTIWIANYKNFLQYDGPYDYWQYTNKGKVNGISGDCDINIMY